MTDLVVVERAPVQYKAPVYDLVRQAGTNVIEVYGSDFSLRRFKDVEFGTEISFGGHFQVGNSTVFLSQMKENETPDYQNLTATGLSAVLKELQPRAVLLTGYASKFDREASRTVFALPNCKTLLRAETGDHALQRSWLKRLIRDWYLRKHYRRFDRLLYIGERSKQHYVRLGVPDHKLVRSPYCVDTRVFETSWEARSQLREQGRRELQASDDSKFVILFSGKLTERKGVDLLPAAIGQLSTQEREKVVLAYMGDGEYRQRVQTACDAIGLHVVFLGFKQQQELSTYYHAADLTVLPSRWGETWGLVVNESLHHGTPVVTSQLVGSTSDLVEPRVTGESFETGSANSLADALRRVMSYARGESTWKACRERVNSCSMEKARDGIRAAL